MVGYSILHITGFWEAILIIVGMPLVCIVVIVLLLNLFYNNWFDDVMSVNLVEPNNIHKKINTNWGKATNPYYKESELTSAPVLYYKKNVKGHKIVITTTADCPKNIAWSGDDFTWLWISEAKRMGWKQNNPPAQPTIIASDGMMIHVEHILAETNGTKPIAKIKYGPLQWDKDTPKQGLLINKHL